MKVIITDGTFSKITSVILLHALHLILWTSQPIVDSKDAADRCPYSWSCKYSDGIWFATSLDPRTENVTVWVATSHRNNFINIDCKLYQGSDLTWPIGFLRNFTWTYISEYQFTSCPIPRTLTLVEVLQGHQVRSLHIKPSTLIQENLTSETFNGLTELASLDLGSCGLTSLPTNLFQKLPNLTWLSLDNNHLSALPSDMFSGLKKIKFLSLANNLLTDLTDSMVDLGTLDNLHVYNSQIKNISREFLASMPKLLSLDAQGNRLTDLEPNMFYDVPMLQTLNLFTNKIRELPPNLLQFQSRLTNLDISDNPSLVSLPKDFLHNLTSIAEIKINRCNLESIPDAFFQSDSLTSLITLELQGNKLKLVQPDLFKSLASLTDLDLSKNQIQVLQNGTFRRLSNLKTLKLNDNSLHTVEPLAFWGLKRLKRLDLSGNNLKTLPKDGLEHVEELEELILRKNQINFQTFFALPMFLLNVTMSHNQITHLPTQWFYSYPSLQLVDLSHNRIEVFSFDDYQPTGQNLLLDLTYNQIARVRVDMTIASAVKSLKSASFVAQSSNKVALGHNPLICDCNAKDLLHYYKHQTRGSSQFEIDMSFLVCKSPPQLADVPVGSLRSQQLTCDIEDNCHPACKCIKHAQGNYLEVDCRNQTFKMPPEPVPWNTSILKLDGNLLESLAGLEMPRWANLTRLHLSKNRITDIKLGQLPSSLVMLNLQDNLLSAMSKEDLTLLDDHPNLNIYLQGNPWKCGCDAKGFQEWLNANVQRLGNVSNIRCNGTNIPIYLENTCVSTAVNTKTVLVGATVLSLLLAIGLATIGIGYYRYRQQLKIWLYSHRWCMWFVTENEIDRDKKYDAFISFSQEDSEFVACHLLPGLEQGEPSYKVCIHYRDWLAGEWIPDQIIHSVQDSRRTIVVLTKNFIQSVWGRLEFKAAHHQALQDQTNRIIIIVYGDLPPSSEMDPELKTYVKFNTYLKWGEPWFWQKLRYAMPHSSLRLPSKRPTTISAISSSITDQPRISVNCIGNSIPNGRRGDKLELVCT